LLCVLLRRLLCSDLLRPAARRLPPPEPSLPLLLLLLRLRRRRPVACLPLRPSLDRDR
jgi:hypothetical protein